jgi:hypothetical protein
MNDSKDDGYTSGDEIILIRPAHEIILMRPTHQYEEIFHTISAIREPKPIIVSKCRNRHCRFTVHSKPPTFFKPRDMKYCCSLCRLSNCYNHGGHCEANKYTRPRPPLLRQIVQCD